MRKLSRWTMTDQRPDGRIGFDRGHRRAHRRHHHTGHRAHHEGDMPGSDQRPTSTRGAGDLEMTVVIRSVPATPAFRDAGLAGPSAGDNGYLYLFAGSLLGPLLTVAGVLWLVVLGLIRVARRARLVRRGGTAGADGT
jgi:hypothetical protein